MEIDEFHHIHEKMKKFVNLRISGSSMISKNEIEIFGNIQWNKSKGSNFEDSNYT